MPFVIKRTFDLILKGVANHNLTDGEDVPAAIDAQVLSEETLFE